MKILYILNSTIVNGGATKSFLSLCNGMKAKGHKITIVCPNSRGVFRTLKDDGYNVLDIKFRANIYPPLDSLRNKILFLPKLLLTFVINYYAKRKLIGFCKLMEPDIIHTNVGVVKIGYSVAKKLKIPHVYHLREYQDLDFGMKWIPSKDSFYKILNSDNNYNICITKDIQRYFLKPNNSVVIYNGISNRFKQMQCDYKSKSKYFIFASGHLSPNKGLDDCIEAYIQFTKKYSHDYDLIIAGDTHNQLYINNLKDRIAKSGLSDKVRFLGMRDDVDQLMRKAYASLVCSKSEGFGRTMAESMFNKCLVLGKNIAGTKEQFDNGLELCKSEIGFRYNSNSELEECMYKVIGLSPQEYNSIIGKAYETVNKLYSDEQYVSKVNDIYEKIVIRK